MANLLERASVVLSPTAYNNGEALCVKPDDGSGDFQFSRNSAATRVNSQGLVEDVQILSSDLVQNGSFSQIGSQEITNGSFSQQGTEQVVDGSFANGDADWNRENSVFTISGGVANGNGANGGSEELSQNFSQDLTAGKTYKVVFELLNYVSGSVQFALTGGGSLFGTSQSADGTFTQYVVVTGNNNKIKFRGANFNGSITSISLVEVGQDWTLGTGWSIGEDKATFDNSSQAYLSQGSVFNLTSTYKITFTISNMVSGFIQFPSAFYSNSLTVTSNGDYTFYTQATNTSLFILGGAGTNGSITNISVKEVGQDWSLATGWSIGTNKAVGDGTSFTNITQTPILIQNKKVKLTFDILDYVSGTFRLIPSDRQDGLDERFSGNGSYEVIYTSTVDFFRFQQQVFIGSVTNIKIIEITDDTNLPRINYEGFSYQDALGSELITNGDFATDSDWTKGVGWSISGGSANGLSTSDVLQQSISSVIGKVYEITGDAVVNSGSLQVFLGGFAGNIISTGSFKIQFSPNNTNPLIFTGVSFTGSIDNVSVKEYLGQQVVPGSGCGSWLWENQSTNLIPYSENFNTWNNLGSRSIITLNSIISPDGTLNGTKQTQNAVSNSVRLRFSSILTIGTEYTFSVFAKKGNYDKLQMNISGVTTNFTLTDNWARYEITVTAPNNTFVDVGIPSGSIGDFIYLWGAQAEEQSYATSYIPTDGTSVTRNQDVCINGGSASTINSTEGSLYAEIAANSNDLSFRLVSLSDGTTSNRVYIGFGSISNQITASLTSGGSQQAFLSHIVSDETQYNKVALKYKLNELSLFVNGSKVATDTTVTMPTLTSLQFTSASTFSKFFGKTKCLAVWKETLTDTELQELTTI